jgi:CDP-diacylglycerol--glycerol-3-phosphate 3-phosphatidyltransferase
MNPANLITILRFVLTPLAIAAILRYDAASATGNETWRFIAFSLFAVASVTDVLDGYIARKLKCVSRLGALMDPLVDKLLCVSVLLALIATSRSFVPISRWYPSVVIAKEIITVGGSAALWKKMPPRGFRPLVVGKLSTLVQMATIMWIILKLPAAHAAVIVSGILAAAAGISYISFGILRLMGKKRWERIPARHDIEASA